MSWVFRSQNIDDPDVSIWQILSSSDTKKYNNPDLPITFREFIDLLIKDETFTEQFSSFIAEIEFRSLRFETPHLCPNSIDQPFEFAIVDSPGLERRAASPRMFSDQFQNAQETNGRHQLVTSFPNLSGSSTLICPLPDQQPDSSIEKDYCHLASFLRTASIQQARELWKLAGTELTNCDLSNGGVWFSTAGGGVPWLHLRIDPAPKYYHFHPYKKRNYLSQ